jgi:iron complex transport system substrate-binding protein
MQFVARSALFVLAPWFIAWASPPPSPGTTSHRSLAWAYQEPLAQRIVSTTPNFTEILFEIGGGDKLVAVSDYCLYPEEARAKPHIGGPFNLSYERIVALRADLVVLPSSLETVAGKLRTLGLSVLQLPNETVTDVLDSITRLGEVSGRSAQADQLAAGMRDELAAVEQKTRGLARARTLIVVLRGAGSLQDLTAASPDTFLNELLILAGGENVITGTIARYPRISREEIVSLDPEVILDLTFSAEGEDTLGIWAQLPTLDAVRTGRVVAIPDPVATIPGPRMIETLRRFVEVLHPEAELPREVSR